MKPYFRKLIHFFKRKESVSDIFTSIYLSNKWGDGDSRSGSGSNLENTKEIRSRLPILFSKYKIKSILDTPCGDFFWMKNVDLSGIMYVGGDIVEEIVISNKKHTSKNISFEVVNIVTDPLKKVDLIIIRDCLVHFSFDQIKSTLDNVCNSNSKYLLTTTFINKTENYDIKTGAWRPLNLQAHPFNLPDPNFIIYEHRGDAEWGDKALALWDIEKIRNTCRK
jgi:hypothetical protein